MAKGPVHPAQLKVGDPLPYDARDARGTLLLRKGHVITTDSQIERLMMHVGSGTTAKQNAATMRRQMPRSSPLAQILDVRHRLHALLSEPERPDFPAEVLRLAAQVRKACRANADIVLASILMCLDDPYAVRQAVNVAIASHVTGVAMQLDAATLTSAMAAALTMNIGMFELQQQLQTLKGALSDELRAEVEGHCERGVSMLEQLGVVDPLWLEIVRDHHERPDGSGYPAGKLADQIGVPTQLVSLADIYCARVSSRMYRSALTPNEALRRLFLNEGATADEHYAALFIKTLGIYPPGTSVRLRNGSIGVVTHRGPSGQRPKVSSITTHDGLRVGVPIRRRGDSLDHAVTEVVDLDDLDLTVSMESLWGGDAEL